MITTLAAAAPVLVTVTAYSTVAPGMALGWVVPLNGSLMTVEVFCDRQCRRLHRVLVVRREAAVAGHFAAPCRCRRRTRSPPTAGLSAPTALGQQVAGVLLTAAAAVSRTLAYWPLVAVTGTSATMNTRTLASAASVAIDVAVSVPAS